MSEDSDQGKVATTFEEAVERPWDVDNMLEILLILTPSLLIK
jgi:hypothetical protein